MPRREAQERTFYTNLARRVILAIFRFCYRATIQLGFQVLGG